ncbi:hypothetical protein Tco_0755986 [Tanacetum coccineum]
METCDPIGTRMEIKDKIDLDKNGTLADETKYHSMIYALMYLTSSRPYIIHVTYLCARYQAQPTEKHLEEAKSWWAGHRKSKTIRRCQPLKQNMCLYPLDFCDSDLEVAFRRNTCFVRNLEGVDLLKGNHTTNLYTINLYEMASASPICLMAHANSTKSKDEAPEEIKTFLKKITVLLQAPVIIVRTDNGTEHSRIKCLRNTLIVLASLTKRLLSEHLNKMESWNEEIRR